MKSLKQDIKAIKSQFERIEQVKDSKPEIYCSESDSYITNPFIEDLYKRVEAVIETTCKSFGLEYDQVVEMTF